ncbi:MAG: spore coat associated protein CotJA [Lachnospiraceae bacterium]
MPNYRNNTTDYMRRYAPCCNNDDVLEGLPIAMAYVPWQMWRKLYDVEKGLCRGTIFEELDKCFQGGCRS